jgi:hypothetical protein
MEAVGVILGSIALLDPIYRSLSGLYKSYKLAKTFEKDLQTSICSLETQGWVSTFHLDGPNN